jgi:hypothetical protein
MSISNDVRKRAADDGAKDDNLNRLIVSVRICDSTGVDEESSQASCTQSSKGGEKMRRSHAALQPKATE